MKGLKSRGWVLALHGLETSQCRFESPGWPPVLPFCLKAFAFAFCTVKYPGFSVLSVAFDSALEESEEVERGRRRGGE